MVCMITFNHLILDKQGIATISRPGSSTKTDSPEPHYEDPYGMGDLMDSIDRYENDPYGTNGFNDANAKEGHTKFADGELLLRALQKLTFYN